jgi:hypothetical protein
LELNAIELTFTDADLAAVLDKYVCSDKLPVSDLEAGIVADGVEIRGQYQASFLKGSFEAIVSLRADGQVVLATLVDLKALGPVGNMFKGVLMSMVQKKLDDIPGVSGDDDAIRIDLAVVLADRGLAAKLGTLDIRCAPGRGTLKLSGTLDCAS